MSALPISVTAYVLPGKPDPAAEAHFANSHHAERHGRELADSGYYCSVLLNDGTESHELIPDPEPADPNGKSYTVAVRYAMTGGGAVKGWYVETSEDGHAPAPGVRNLTSKPEAERKGTRMAERLRSRGATVNLTVEEGH